MNYLLSTKCKSHTSYKLLQGKYSQLSKFLRYNNIIVHSRPIVHIPAVSRFSFIVEIHFMSRLYYNNSISYLNIIITIIILISKLVLQTYLITYNQRLVSLTTSVFGLIKLLIHMVPRRNLCCEKKVKWASLFVSEIGKQVGCVKMCIIQELRHRCWRSLMVMQLRTTGRWRAMCGSRIVAGTICSRTAEQLIIKYNNRIQFTAADC